MSQPHRQEANKRGLNLTLLEKRCYRSVSMSMDCNESSLQPVKFIPRIAICPDGIPPREIFITGFLNIILSYNEGVSFGLFSDILRGRPEIIVATSSVIVAGLLVWMTIAGDRLEAAGLGPMAGGASGNIFDRMQRGKVTDFIDFHLAEWHWPAFNLADVAIVIGALILVGGSFVRPRPVVIGKSPPGR